jgi:Leucine-rich repeat (LRR) protein
MPKTSAKRRGYRMAIPLVVACALGVSTAFCPAYASDDAPATGKDENRPENEDSSNRPRRPQLLLFPGPRLAPTANKALYDRCVELNALVSATDEGRAWQMLFDCQSELRDGDLKTLPGLDKIQTLVLWIAGAPVTDATLKDAAALPGLKALMLTDAPVTGSALVHFRDRKKLVWLDLSGTKIMDENLEPLADFTGLQVIGLSKTAITDEGMAVLGRLKQLHWLTLSDTKISDAGLAQLEGFQNLEMLDLTRTEVTGVGFRNLSLPKLQNLKLNGAAVTDNSLSALRGLESLKTLDISGTNVTDDGLMHLKDMEKLRAITARDTQVTEDGAKRMKKLKPGFTVDFGKRE